ncbi:MAG TPA: hypothetical protein VHV47_03440, partial [Opitutaceae bacterium]|nr:hypothetical protein [Opitutaceae bacterium]
MPDEYSAAFRRHLRTAPLAQAAGLARFQARLLRAGGQRRDTARLRAAAAAGAPAEPTGTALRPPPHHYRGYRGPWIEDYFFRSWLAAPAPPRLRYLPVFWTDIYLHVQNHWFTPGQHRRIFREIDGALGRLWAGRHRAFTVVEYDHPLWGWHAFPRNVAVFSAGGGGDIPIPLLKGSPRFTCPEKDLRLS